MYYEESIINGVLHFRNHPNSKWIKFTLEQLSQRVVSLIEQHQDNDELSDDLNELISAEKENRIKKTETFIPAFEDNIKCHFFWFKTK